jgi:hypothetical protein
MVIAIADDSNSLRITKIFRVESRLGPAHPEFGDDRELPFDRLKFLRRGRIMRFP